MTVPYQRNDAQAWGRVKMRGVCNDLMSTFVSSLRQLNPAAIRHRDMAPMGRFGEAHEISAGSPVPSIRQTLIRVRFRDYGGPRVDRRASLHPGDQGVRAQCLRLILFELNASM